MSAVRIFVAKPLRIEAVKWLGEENCEEVHEFMGFEHDHGGAEGHGEIWFTDANACEGVITPGEWIVRAAEGGVGVMNDDDFRKTFEPVEGEWWMNPRDVRTDIFSNGLHCKVTMRHLPSGERVTMEGDWREEAELVKRATEWLRQAVEEDRQGHEF